MEQTCGVNSKTTKDEANVNDAEQEKTMVKAIKILNKFRKKIKLIRDFSNVAAREFQKKLIDFIYIDARHDFRGAYQDLRVFYLKLKCNGIMAGNNYHTVEEVLKFTKSNK